MKLRGVYMSFARHENIAPLFLTELPICPSVLTLCLPTVTNND